MRVATAPTARRRAHHDPPPRSQLGAARPAGHRLRRRSPRADGRRSSTPARHPAGHRPDRLRQDDHALRLPLRDQLARPQHPHRRGSGRVPARGHLADPGQPEDRSDLRRPGCARSCATTPTSSWSARSAIARPPRSRSQASLTGHFVFSTIHTNDAAGAITRLVDMGIEPFLVALVADRPAGPAPGAPAVPRVRASRYARPRRCCASSASMPQRVLRRRATSPRR